MGADSTIAAIGAALPVPGPDAVATLKEESTPPMPAPAGTPVIAATEVTELSITGKLLAALLQAPANPESLASAAPLLPHAVRDTPVIAEAIRKGVEHSGLFYESHLAEWVSGQRELDALKKEPQASITAADKVPGIVRQQLEMLDSQPLQWRGEMWPGMTVHLQIDKDPVHTHDTTSDELQQAWSSTLVSELPALGSVVAKLRIVGDRLQLKLSATDDSSALLAEHASQLRGSMAAAGLQLQRFDADGERQA